MKEEKQEIDIVNELVTIMDFYKYKLLNGGCTIPEMMSLLGWMMENMEIEGTVEDFARFYGVSEQSVRNIISRYMVQKPLRRVFYKFNLFAKIIPAKWRKNRHLA